MTWDSNVTVSVVTGAQPVDRAVLNIPLHLSAPTFPERVRTYSSAAEAAADTLLDQSGLDAVNAHFAQALFAPQIKIGRSGDAAVAQVVTITVGGTPLEDEVYRITINGITVEHVAGASPTVLSVHTALDAALVTALANEDITVSGTSPNIICTADIAGEPFSYSAEVDDPPGGTATGTLVAVLTTDNAGIGSDLDACLLEDDGWYGLTVAIDPTPATNLANMKACSNWAQINKKLFIGQSNDTDVLTAAATNDLEELANKNNSRTCYIWHHDNSELAAVAWMSYTFWADPDVRTTNWAYKPLSGISIKPTPLTSTELGNIESQYGNAFATFGGNGVVSMGISTTNRKIDLIITADWLEARLQEAYIQLLSDVAAADDKIGISDKELQAIVNAGQDILDKGVKVKHLLADSTSISIPAASTIVDRTVPVTAQGTALGAAEIINVTMTLILV